MTEVSGIFFQMDPEDIRKAFSNLSAQRWVYGLGIQAAAAALAESEMHLVWDEINNVHTAQGGHNCEEDQGEFLLEALTDPKRVHKGKIKNGIKNKDGSWKLIPFESPEGTWSQKKS